MGDARPITRDHEFIRRTREATQSTLVLNDYERAGACYHPTLSIVSQYDGTQTRHQVTLSQPAALRHPNTHQASETRSECASSCIAGSKFVRLSKWYTFKRPLVAADPPNTAR